MPTATSAAPDEPVRDVWLRPILVELAGADAVASIESRMIGGYWESAARQGIVNDERLTAAVAARCGMPAATRLSVSAQARERVPEDVARRYRVLPLSLSEDAIEIATSDPYDLDCERALAFRLGVAVRMRIASPIRIAERLDEVYRPQDVLVRLVEGLGERYDLESVPEALDAPSPDLFDDPRVERPVVRLVDHILAQGIAQRASDIHLEPEERGVVVRYRIDGVLREVMVVPRALAPPLVSRVKIMAKLDIADRLRPQGGRARVVAAGAALDLRISTLPASLGEKVVIRLLDARTTLRSLDSLGFTPDDAARVERLLEARDGLVLVTGPTGSGKTTTLYAMLRRLQERGVNIVTVEDPVEYRIPGIVQVQVSEKAGLTFTSALRSILRQDPDIVLIGEIRDRETAGIAIQAALTGHLVLGTLHTIDACTAIMRLRDLGVDAEKIAASLRGVLAQRLLRAICGQCGGGPGGCSRCSGSGLWGRLAASEVVVASDSLTRAVAAGADGRALSEIARGDGARSLWESGVEHVQAGRTTLIELRRVVDEREEHYVQYHSSHDLDRQGGPVTDVVVGVVDVYVLRRERGAWRVLLLRRSAGTRCPSSWETVHGRVHPDERPEEAAVREVKEETGLAVGRLYNATVQPFYLFGAVQLAVVFAAVVESDDVALSEEHDTAEWLAPQDALARYSWPRSRDALTAILSLLAGGDAGPIEDVLRVV